MDIVVHPGTIEDEETVRGIRSSGKIFGAVKGRGRGGYDWYVPLEEKRCALETILLPLPFVESV
jgi:hypothetical protein